MARFRPRTVVLIAALVVLDIAVVVLAIALSRRGGDPSAAASRPSSSSTGASDDEPLSGPLTLTASPSGALARVTRGSCDSRAPERPRVWVSTSYLGPMTPRAVPGLRESLGVSYGRDRLVVVGTDSSCRVHGFTSSDGGATWARGAVPRSIWWLDPDTTSSTVHGPARGGDVDVRCVPVSVVTTSDGALVSCGDSGLVRLDRDGTVTSADTTTPGLAAAASDSGDRVLLLADTVGCSARLLVVVDRQPPRGLTCVGPTQASLGLAVSGTRWFVQVGYRLAVTDDGGRSFTDYAKDPVTAEAG